MHNFCGNPFRTETKTNNSAAIVRTGIVTVAIQRLTMGWTLTGNTVASGVIVISPVH